MTPTPEQEAAVGKLVCGYIDAPRPWRVFVGKRRDGALEVSKFHPSDFEPPKRHLVTRDGMVTETTNLD